MLAAAAAICSLAIVAVGGIALSTSVKREHQEKLAQIAVINATPSVRYSILDEEGRAKHTLCSGGGWCVTDSVPPEEVGALARRGVAISVIDQTAIAAALKDGK
jgi:hypothetical protein